MSDQAIEIQSVDSELPIEQLFAKISDLDYPVWLDSSDRVSGRYHLISAAPATQIQAEQATPAENVEFFNRAKHLVSAFTKRNAMPGIPFQGGIIGYLSYELGAASLDVTREAPPLIPAGYFGLYLWALVVDKLNQSRQLVFHPKCDSETKELVLARFQGGEPHTAGKSSEFRLKDTFTASVQKPDYAQDLTKINAYIHAGDVYQVNYAHHFSASYAGDPAIGYRALREFAPAPYSGYLGLGQRGANKQAILCHSPEQFLEIKGRHVRTSPIKGTAPRSGDRKLDERNADVLLESEKDRAENLMIVDLMRNDLGKLCVPGSVQTSKLFQLKSYSNVHHLVSEIVGELSEGNSALDMLANAVPAGSITGAPKKRSVEIIRELESEQRSFYCGNLGYLSLCGNMDFNIGIRSLVADGESIHCWGGGGIVADSNPEKEYLETLHKVGGLMSELERLFLAAEKPSQTSA